MLTSQEKAIIKKQATSETEWIYRKLLMEDLQRSSFVCQPADKIAYYVDSEAKLNSSLARKWGLSQSTRQRSDR